MSKILIVDDEKKIRETIYDYLTFKGMDVDLAEDGEEAIAKTYEQSYDLIIMDVMMPVCNGIEACKEIREFSDVPVLFLSALGEEEDLMKGYLAGADDYIIKPFPLAVLTRKCQVMIARYRGINKENSISIGGITCQLTSMKVLDGEKELPISGKDYQLLLYLMQNKGHVLSREMILNKIWGFDYDGDDRVVDTRIKRIRKALGKKASLIRTKVNAGYMFEVGV